MIESVSIGDPHLTGIIESIDRHFEGTRQFTLRDISLALFYHHLSVITGRSSYRQKQDGVLEEVLQWLEVADIEGIMADKEAPFFLNCLADVVNRIHKGLGPAGWLYERIERFNGRLMASGWLTREWESWGYLDGWTGIVSYFLALPAHMISRAAFLKEWEALPEQWIKTRFGQPGAPFGQKGKIDTGLALGIAGILTVLEKLTAITSSQLLAQLLEENVQQLVRWRQEVDQQSGRSAIFPYLVDNEQREAHYDNHLWWRNSDPGHAILLYKTGLMLENEHYTRIATFVALNTLLRREEKDTGVYNASIMNGAAGVAELYRKLFEMMGNESLLEGYRYWISETLRLLDKDLAEDRFAGKEKEILEGLAGIGLTLAFHTHKNMSSWSPVLLL